MIKILSHTETFLYIMLLTGVFILAYPGIEELIRIIKVKLYARKKSKHKNAEDDFYDFETINEVKDNSVNKINEHIRLLITSVFGGKDIKNIALYYELGTLLLFFMSLYILKMVISAKTALIISLLIAGSPYFIMRILLEKKRNKASREGEELLTELLSQYRINYLNMTEAVAATAKYIQGAPTTKKLLYKLARDLRNYRDEKELKKILSDFDYNYKTNWSNILRINLFYAVNDGLEVTESLKDLLETVYKAKKVMEHSKRQGSDAGNILKIFVPVGYALTVVGAVKFFDFTLAKFFSYQFGTASGMQLFTYMIIAYVISIYLVVFFSSKKMDI